jgi:hypothetical protein
MVSLVVLCPLLCAQLANDTHVTPAKAGRGTHWMYSSTAELVGSSGTLSCEANKKNEGGGGRCVDVVIIIAAAVVAVMAVVTVEVAARVAGSDAGTFPRAYLQRLVMHASNPFKLHHPQSPRSPIQHTPGQTTDWSPPGSPQHAWTSSGRGTQFLRSCTLRLPALPHTPGTSRG